VPREYKAHDGAPGRPAASHRASAGGLPISLIHVASGTFGHPSGPVKSLRTRLAHEKSMDPLQNPRAMIGTIARICELEEQTAAVEVLRNCAVELEQTGYR
jgi:hypothetical protein